MTGGLPRRLRKSWHLARRRFGADAGAPLRLVVEKAPWLGDARSPVMLMIDDLANAWHDRGGGSRWEAGGDWGGGLDAPGSALDFLERRLLADYPEVRVTFFTVAGPLAPYTRHQPFSHSAALDASDESRRFFRRLAEDPRFELAYHGFDHGTPGESTAGFVQEWRGFPSVEAAVEQTRRGLAHFTRATGRTPRGGKYGGWEYNDFADEAVDACGFRWWCRDWMPRDVSDRVPDGYYEPQLFGGGPVVALPSTVHGHFWDPRQLDLLLLRRQVIAIEEHVAPIRPDGLVQTPNIVDDLEELRRLYARLRSRSVWHATGTEIASYVLAREATTVTDVTRDGFTLRYAGAVARPRLTLGLDCSAVCSPDRPLIAVTPPGDESLGPEAFRFDRTRYRHLVTLPVVEGRYHVRPAAG